jgi:trans-aconitate methyltransferase
METWEISKTQKKLLDDLMGNIDAGQINRVLDVGSGRTSIGYLTDKFKDLKITGIIYPDDEERMRKLKESVKNQNYELVKTDIKDFDKSQDYDLVLAHLFLGEATKYGGNNFEEILENLFALKTKYLMIVNVSYDDAVSYFLLLKKIAQAGKIAGLSYVPSPDSEADPRDKFGGGTIGLLIEKVL